MERYIAYKVSAVPSFGNIPTHWDEIRTKFLFDFGRGLSISRENMSDKGVPCIHYGDIHGNYGFEVNLSTAEIGCVDESYLMESPQAVVNYGDFLFVGTSEDTDGSGNFTYINAYIPALAGSDTIILRALKPMNYRFMAYMFDSDAYREQIRTKVYGVKVFHPTQVMIKNALSVLPLVEEQTAITAYLDLRTAEIDTLLADLARQAGMLDRYKQELIADAVIHGLDKAVPRKDSCVDWIGEAPSHWNVTKIKWMFEIVKRIYGKEDRDVLSITQRGLKVKDIESHDGQLAESYANYQVVNVNDFAMNSMDLLTGWVDCSQFEGVTSPDYRVFRFLPSKTQCHNYYKYLFQMCYKNRIFYRLGQGVSNLGRWRLQADQFLNMRLPHPPIDEQERIAAYLDAKTAKIEGLIADIAAQTEKLKQYRQIAIHDAVTGKIKVTEG
jgi:type I restriction enzyme S subunit